jgi:hypothetical protein
MSALAEAKDSSGMDPATEPAKNTRPESWLDMTLVYRTRAPH